MDRGKSHSRIFLGLNRKLRTAAGAILIGTVGLSFLPASVTRSDSSNKTLAETSAAIEAMPSLKGDEAIEHLKQQGTYDSLQEAMAATRYEARWQSFPQLSGLDPSYEFQNSANNLLAYITPDGIQATVLGDEKKSWRLGLTLKEYGYGDALLSVQPGEVKASQNRVSIQRSAIGNRQSAIEEWFVNSPRGIEQGFTISSPPESAIRNSQSAIEKLRLRLAVSGDWQVTVNGEGNGAAFTRAADNVLLGYNKLFAVDAKGRALEARMQAETGGLVIEVADGGAVYPLTIDPLLSQQQKLTASDGAALDHFAFSVAISGDTVVVGAEFDDGGEGSAYIFVRSGTTWTQQAKLTASHQAASDLFGYSVGISGDTVVVGANFDDVGANADQGSAYVFMRSGTTWTQQQKLTASDGAAFDLFGFSVAISGDTVMVGALGDDVGSNNSQGSAYVFVRSGVSWTQQAQLTASDGATNDEFGVSVGISGDTVVVGALADDVGANAEQGSAYVFVRSGTTWTQQAQLTASDGAALDDFGVSVAVSGDTVVVGADDDEVGANARQGSAYVFVRSGTTWTQQQKLTASDGAAFDHFGFSVAISGDTVVVGAYVGNVGANTDQGSAYVFVRSGTTWTQQAQLTASDGAASDHFGVSIAISGDTVVVGADDDDVGANGEQGSAYVFVCDYSEQFHATASDGAGSDQFGVSVAISVDTVVVGANLDDVGANATQGSAYVFVRSGVTWAQQAKLTASDGAALDQFGVSVALNGDTVVVGANLDDVGANASQGSAYVFVRSGTTWMQQAQLTASDGAAFDHFGVSIGISGDNVVVGADDDDMGGNANQGSAYVFVRSGVSWTQQAQLSASDGAGGDNFGVSVAISGDTVVVGAASDDVGTNNGQGSAYVFVRNGTTWTQQQKLTASDGAASDQFGVSVAISGDTVVAGAGLGSNANQGSAYVFVRSGVSWTQQAQLLASDGATNDLFGFSVAISGDTVVAGAIGDDVGANANQGSAYIFARSGLSWTQQQKLTASDGAASDFFGNSIGISGDTVMVGALGDDVGANFNQGSAYVFFKGCNTAPVIVASGGIARQKGSPATTSTIATVDDAQDPIGYLTVSVASAPAGLSITNLTNTNGVIAASIAATCAAILGNNIVILQVVDSDGGVGTVQLVISVTSNSAPTLGIYPNTSVAVLGATTVTPNLIPADNGSIVSFSATSPTYTGISSVNLDTGVVSISNARPGGTHVFTVTAIDNCGIATTSGFLLTVTCQAVTVHPSTIPAGTAGTAYSETFTQTGGNGTVTFSLTGTLPTGMSFTAGTATLSGTPTQVGSFTITVTATDENNCSGSRNYTLTITAPMLVWNGSLSSNWHTASNWTPNAVPTTYHDVSIPFSGVVNQPVIANASASINAMILQAGRILTINSSRQLATAGNITSGGQITGAGSLLFDGGTFTQNGSVSLASVEFNAGFHGLAGGGAFASGIITVLNGANVTLTSNHSVSVIVINSGGSFDVTNRTLTLTGAGTAIFNSGSFTATGSTIIYQGSISQVVTANINYNNLTINNAAGVFLTGDTTVSGLLNLTTDLTTTSFILTMPPSGTSTGSGDVIGNVKRTGFATGGAALSFGNPLNTIQINSGTAPTDITMNLVKLPPFGFSNCVSRTYSIAANGGVGISATMRLRYKDVEATGLDESSFDLWRYDGANWLSPLGTATRDTAQNWVQETGIAQFSQWTIAGASGPSCGVLTPNSQFFRAAGSGGSVVVTALPACGWTAASNASWLQVTSSQSGTGSDVVTYVVRDNFTSVPRQGILTISGLAFTVVQEGSAAPDCVFSISAASVVLNASGGAGSVDVITGAQCAWQAVSNDSWITITSNCCAIANGTVTYSVAAKTGTSGRNGTITIAGQTFSVKQKGN